jgi:hypothetical protein
MKDSIKFRLVGIPMMLVMCAVFGLAAMLLWNLLMPQIFALPSISFLQAVGLLILARLLFGGMGAGLLQHAGHHHAGHWGAKDKLREKWMKMSEDERVEFIKKEKDFFKSQKCNRCFSHFREHFGDEREMEQREERKESRNE